MFAYTGMSGEMVDTLAEKHAIFLTRDGRISIAGLNTGNVATVARAMHEVTQGKPIGQTAASAPNEPPLAAIVEAVRMGWSWVTEWLPLKK